ncbi:MAG TPA: hypothetical protein VI248_05425 [Kineosporiaceae bacterium]
MSAGVAELEAVDDDVDQDAGRRGLVGELATAHTGQREGHLHQRRGGRPLTTGRPAAGRPPTVSLDVVLPPMVRRK